MLKRYKDFLLEDYGDDSYEDPTFKTRFEKFKAALSGKPAPAATPSAETPSQYKNFVPSNDSFSKVVSEVIDKLEGGYYHPDMLKDGRVRDKRKFKGKKNNSSNE